MYHACIHTLHYEKASKASHFVQLGVPALANFDPLLHVYDLQLTAAV